MNLRNILFLILIVAIAFFLRFYKVTEVPPSLNWDEVSIAYNAYSVMKTGKDEWGVTFPVHFKAYGEYKLPAQIYVSIPGIYLFGLNELGVRITPVIYGTLTVLLLYFLTRKIFRSDLIGATAAFLLAISPWHIQLTRASFESSFAVFWIVLGVWLLVKGFEDKKWLILAMIPLALSVYTYNSARVFVPLFLVVILWIYRKDLLRWKKQLLVVLILFGVLLLPLVPFTVSQDRNSRYKLVSVTDDPGLVPRINERRGLSTLPDPLPRLIHNKVTYISYYIASNYLAHFTPDFLFISGAPHKQHHVQGVGQLYLFQLPLLFIGLYCLFKEKNKFRFLLSSWILLGFVPVSVTNDSIPHALRTMITLPPFLMVCGLGIVKGWQWVKNRGQILSSIVLLTFTAMVVFSIYLYLQNLFFVYPKNYSRDWQYGYKEVVEYVKENQDKYDTVIFSRHYGEPHMFMLFFLGFDPVQYQNNSNLIRFETHDWVRVLKFDKYYFPDLGDTGTKFEDIIEENQGKKLLFIGKGGDLPSDVPRLKTVNFLDGNLAFEIVEWN
ncbi:hypothetical protein A3C32_04460 [Candidatus Daviesbacteria bacterium RIFCSPHIGHO2_02_FULL_41_14]|uniref:ArnT-like N-terminal domain-containing protein n=1 Tax=Candidatus Daviesbacteria bacterium RIFCSPLOWO2_01_FULL_40_24 TaxID=1797787 RepID=A0A1F5MJG8_9BACT|nr:MAG: hypothetical protein A3C32_04460 [Candidatus Daviesbacteria bacterium RIFCSPHIGHO2_02_FULL_41_14]OGE65479.1 MAG: hypothetical protein A3B49_01155 [Candidatus Daviesbacteria bacterium RIFCSPLOWO2_01_FULL_40_24]